jgi:hypothetical protein
MTQRDTISKWLAYGAVLLVVTVFNYYVLGPAPLPLPVLLPMAAVAVGTLEGPAFGAGLGGVAGLVLSSAGHAGPVCVAALAAVGWLCGLLTLYVLRRDFWGHMLCAIATALLWEAAQVLPRLLTGVAGSDALLRVAVPELICTLLFSMPVYWLCLQCCRRFGRIRYE